MNDTDADGRAGTPRDGEPLDLSPDRPRGRIGGNQGGSPRTQAPSPKQPKGPRWPRRKRAA